MIKEKKAGSVTTDEATEEKARIELQKKIVRLHKRNDRLEKQEEEAGEACSINLERYGFTLRDNRYIKTGEWNVGLTYIVCDAEGERISPMMDINETMVFTLDVCEATPDWKVSA